MTDKWLSHAWSFFDNAEGTRGFYTVGNQTFVDIGTCIFVFMDLGPKTRVWWLGRPGGGGQFCTPLREMQAAYPAAGPPKWVAANKDFWMFVVPGSDPPDLDVRQCPP